MSSTLLDTHEAEDTGGYSSPLSRQKESSVRLVKERFAIPSRDGTEIFLWRIATCHANESSTPQPAIVYAHGGAFIHRNLNMEEVRLDKFNDSLIGRMGPKPLYDSGCVLLYVSYRIAGEAPFPKPVEDVYTAYEYALTNATTLGILKDKICFTGVSAGAHLALAATMMVMDQGLRAPCGQMLIYPMLDPEARLGERNDLAVGWERFLCNLDNVPVKLQKYARLLDLSPEDLAKLPPTYIDVGDQDPFHEELFTSGI
ncbi:hypothetical protein FANTH_12254 [Fusarium anthophilum]|uniref:Alpha/beta hydrolase fold-3 domain-containing protein n=1 Tax=Fusarium anthophilum TaxID=48485 RepID=A0A8H4YUH4_9HYPO|nr:hypothetical protein FANTH_12254 [Fusarium anthophilum]